MSDISFNFEWWELLLFSPMIGWPGLLIGAALGALLWKPRRLLGAVAGAVLGNLAWAGAAVMLF